MAMSEAAQCAVCSEGSSVLLHLLTAALCLPMARGTACVV